MSLATAATLTRLEALVGSDNFSSDPEELKQFSVDGQMPAAVAQPGTVDEVAELVQFAAAENKALIPAGNCTKLHLGGPPKRYDVAVSSRRLGRVLAYEPKDLTLAVEAGIALGRLQETLAEENQFLPLGSHPLEARGTLGGILATNSSGSLRQLYGTARDFVIGMEFVTGEGTRAKSGGRVVKNVAGYDLHKVMIGSLGTLGFITSVNFKTFPLPPAKASFAMVVPNREEALSLTRAITHSVLRPTALEIVSPEGARFLKHADPKQRHAGPLSETAWTVVASAAGNDRVVQRYETEFERLAGEAHATTFAVLRGDDEKEMWSRYELLPTLATLHSPAAMLVRISALPTQFGAVLEQCRQIADRGQLPSAALVRAAGVVYLALLPPARDEATLARLMQTAKELFQAAANFGGRAVIELCPAELRRAVNVWGPAGEELKLMQKLKSVFDPKDILSPGRFVGGI